MSPATTFRLPPIHTQRTETSPWDGCWCLSLAEGIDAATGGKLLVTEAQVRRAAANPDRPGVSDGGNIKDQLQALQKLAPAVVIKAYPTAAQFVAHLKAGGGAVMSGYQRDAPIGQRKYDTRFYDRRDNGHNVYGQGVGDGIGMHWLDPLIPAGAKPPIYPIIAALDFCWGSTSKREVILVWPVELVTTPGPPADRVRVKDSWWDYDITGTKAAGYDIGRTSRVTRGYTAALTPSRIDIAWGGKQRLFAKVADGAYIGAWVDLTGAPNVTHLPA